MGLELSRPHRSLHRPSLSDPLSDPLSAATTTSTTTPTPPTNSSLYDRSDASLRDLPLPPVDEDDDFQSWPGRVVIIDEPGLHRVFPHADLSVLLQLVSGAHAAPVAFSHVVTVEPAPLRSLPRVSYTVLSRNVACDAAVRFEVIHLLMQETERAQNEKGVKTARTIALVVPPDHQYSLPVLLARRAGCNVEIWLCVRGKENGGLMRDLAPRADGVGLLFVHRLERFGWPLTGEGGPQDMDYDSQTLYGY